MGTSRKKEITGFGVGIVAGAIAGAKIRCRIRHRERGYRHAIHSAGLHYRQCSRRFDR